MAAPILYLTELVGLRVFDLKGRGIGRIKEAAIVPLVHPARVDRFLVGAGDAWWTIRHEQVAAISLQGIRLKDERVTPYHSDEYMLRLIRDLLDQQIIDARGRKVVRVTDVTFEVQSTETGTDLLVVEVDVGLRSVLRRLLQGVLPRTWIRRLQAPIAPNSIAWDSCNIIEPDPMRRLRLNITPTQLEQMHPADLADIVEELGPEGREAVLTSMDSEAAAEALSEVEHDIQVSILESLEAEKAAKILEEMDADEAADVLQELEEEQSDEILDEMDLETKEDVEELLTYDEHTAGGLMNIDYVSLDLTRTVGEARDLLRASNESSELLPAVFATGTDNSLAAQIPVAKLLVAEPNARLLDLDLEPAVHVRVDAGEEKVVEMFDRYNLLCLPVVDENRHMLGVITADDVISLLRRKR